MPTNSHIKRTCFLDILKWCLVMNWTAVKEISLLRICKWKLKNLYCYREYVLSSYSISNFKFWPPQKLNFMPLWHLLHLFKASIIYFNNSPFSVEIKITLNYNLLFIEKYVVLMSLSSTCILWALMYPVLTPPYWILFNY